MRNLNLEKWVISAGGHGASHGTFVKYGSSQPFVKSSQVGSSTLSVFSHVNFLRYLLAAAPRMSYAHNDVFLTALICFGNFPVNFSANLEILRKCLKIFEKIFEKKSFPQKRSEIFLYKWWKNLELVKF